MYSRVVMTALTLAFALAGVALSIEQSSPGASGPDPRRAPGELNRFDLEFCQTRPAKVADEGLRIAAGPKGMLWVINSDSELYRLENEKWEKVSKAAKEVSIGADGSIWII